MSADHSGSRGVAGGRRRGSGSVLPAPLTDLVHECLRASRTRGSDRVAVERELVAHLEDALDAGQPVARIIADFGDPERTGILIGHARSRLGYRRGISLVRATALGAAATVACVYVSSAALLHSGVPAAGAAVTGQIPAALLDARRLDPQAASRLVDTLLVRMYTARGPGEGRLTADGLRIVQRLKGSGEPSVKALAAEPAYFAFPATRAAVRREADRVLGLADRARVDGPGSETWGEFEREVARFDWTHVAAYRYVPLAVVLPRLAAAMRDGARTASVAPRLSPD